MKKVITLSILTVSAVLGTSVMPGLSQTEANQPVNSSEQRSNSNSRSQLSYQEKLDRACREANYNQTRATQLYLQGHRCDTTKYPKAQELGREGANILNEVGGPR